VSDVERAFVAACDPDAGPGRRPAGPLITVSATYGAGGSVVAPRLAGRLGIPFLQRVTTSAGALSEHGPSAERLSADERRIAPVSRLFASLTQAMPAGPTLSPPSTHRQDDDLRRRVEAEIHRLVAGSRGVILGRAAAIVLGKDRGYHVRLDGPSDLRLVQGAAIEGVGLDEARAHLRAADAARHAYVRHLYHVDPSDAEIYHLVIDSTAIPLDNVIDLIVMAVGSVKPVAHGPTQPDTGAPRAAT
jgi:cytidylate kinase